MKKKQHAEHENAERWLLTYADLITLLLAFFIVMYSMSMVDAKKFGAVSTALNRILSGGGLLLKGDKGTALAATERYVPVDSENLRAVMQEIITELKDRNLIAKVRVRQDSRGLVLSLSDKVLFESGKADLDDSARVVLDTLGTVLAKLPNEVRIEGHTDNVPIHSGRFDSNWELSAARATSVVRYLTEHRVLPPYQMSAAGYGEYRPVADNDTPDNRMLNRRVDFVIVAQHPVNPADMTRQEEISNARDSHGR